MSGKGRWQRFFPISVTVLHCRAEFCAYECCEYISLQQWETVDSLSTVCNLKLSSSMSERICYRSSLPLAELMKSQPETMARRRFKNFQHREISPHNGRNFFTLQIPFHNGWVFRALCMCRRVRPAVTNFINIIALLPHLPTTASL